MPIVFLDWNMRFLKIASLIRLFTGTYLKMISAIDGELYILEVISPPMNFECCEVTTTFRITIPVPYIYMTLFLLTNVTVKVPLRYLQILAQISTWQVDHV